MKPKKRIYSDYGSKSWNNSQNKYIIREGYSWLGSGRCSITGGPFRTFLRYDMYSRSWLRNFIFCWYNGK